MTQDPIRSARNQKATEEIQIIEIRRPFWHRLPNCAHETDNVDQDAADVGHIAAPMDTGCEIVRTRFLGRVQLLHSIIATADNVVIGDHHSGDGGKENRVG